MKRILFILHIPPPVHGSSIVGEYIVNSEKINENFETEHIDLGTSKSIEDIGKGGIKKFFQYIYILKSIFNQLLFNRPDLVYLAITAKGLAFYKDMVVVIFAKMFRIKLVLHFHNKGVLLRQERFVDDLLYRTAFYKTKVILLSKYLLYDIKKYVNQKNVYYCPNGVCKSQYGKIKNYKIDGKPRINLLFLSNLIKSKGVLILLEACKILKNQGLSFHCTFIGGEGDINEASFLKEVIRLDIEDVISYKGKKFGVEKEQAFLEADIFVFPSTNDCFPLVLLEAMQYSLPIITTYEGGIPEIVVNNVNGYLIEKDDNQVLADRLKELILSPELRTKFGQKGREIYEKKFTIEIFEETFINNLKSILG